MSFLSVCDAVLSVVNDTVANFKIAQLTSKVHNVYLLDAQMIYKCKHVSQKLEVKVICKLVVYQFYHFKQIIEYRCMLMVDFMTIPCFTAMRVFLLFFFSIMGEEKSIADYISSTTMNTIVSLQQFTIVCINIDIRYKKLSMHACSSFGQRTPIFMKI